MTDPQLALYRFSAALPGSACRDAVTGAAVRFPYVFALPQLSSAVANPIALLTVPAIAILVIIAGNIDRMSTFVMALVVASLGWMFTARTVRAQVLSIREKAYVEVARVNGEGPWEILFREVMPNIMPYIVASFVGTVSGSILAVIGLEALGLGALEEMTLGNTIYWSQQSSAVLRGYWWWWGPPIVMIALIFIGLFLTSVGFDRFANPRLARR